MSSITVIHQGSGAPRTYRSHRSQLGYTLVELLIVIIIIGILAAIVVPICLGAQKSAWNTATLSDVKNASSTIETYSAELSGRLPPSFERASSPNGRKYTLKNFDTEKVTNTTSDISITISPDVSLCYTPGTAFVDKDGNKLPYSTSPRDDRSAGVYNGLNYRIYATNDNNLDVFYLFDSATGTLSQEKNPDHIPASAQDTEGSVSQTDPTWWNPVTRKDMQITLCDLELHYHLYGN